MKFILALTLVITLSGCVRQVPTFTQAQTIAIQGSCTANGGVNVESNLNGFNNGSAPFQFTCRAVGQ